MITQTTEAESFSDYQEVLKALAPYINGARKGDGKLSRTAFFDHAHIVGSIAGEFENNTADEFSDAVTSLGEAPNIQHHVAWIDISGPAAAAKVEFLDWKGFRFTDFFVLYKKDGQWKISGKTYDSHSQN
ncbi:MAG: nuclear transport factor 2 family protein [Ekhidna sp.]